jgi:hypothetical protein
VAAQARKLGINEGTSVLLIDAPPRWRPSPLPAGCALRRLASASVLVPAIGRTHVSIAFASDAAQLNGLAVSLSPSAAALAPLWICWPRRASGHASDIDDNDVRGVGLGMGLVDNKVAAVDEDWSGLRFARRRSST